MPINTLHPYYDRYYDLWQRARDFDGGEDDVKEACLLQSKGEGIRIYLPRPSGHTDADYRSYVELADFLDAVSVTIELFSGAVFRKPLKVNYPDEWDSREFSFKKELEDVTGTGIPIEDYAKEQFEDFLRTGRHFTLLSMDPIDERRVRGPARPYWVSLAAEQNTFWTDEGDRWVFVKPELASNSGDLYELRLVPIWHELILERNDMGEGVYVHVVYRGSFDQIQPEINTHQLDYRSLALHGKAGHGGTPPVEESRIYPGFGEGDANTGGRFNFLPVCLFTAGKLTNDPVKPPLMRIVNLARRYYRIGAEYAWNMHWSIIKQPWISGATKDEVSKNPRGMVFGGSHILVLPNVNAKLDIAEVHPQGYEAFEAKLQSTRTEIAALGTHTLIVEKRAVETAEALAIRKASPHATLQTWVDKQERCLERTVRWHAYMGGFTDQVDDERITVVMNRDFVPGHADPAYLMAMLQYVLNNKMTIESLFHNLEQADMVAPDETFDIYETRLSAQREPAMDDEPDDADPMMTQRDRSFANNGRADPSTLVR